MRPDPGVRRRGSRKRYSPPIVRGPAPRTACYRWRRECEGRCESISRTGGVKLYLKPWKLNGQPAGHSVFDGRLELEMLRRIVDQCESIRRRIGALPELARSAIAVEAAGHLMDQHLKLREEQRMAFTVTWAKTISMLREALSNPSVELTRDLETKLKEYRSGPHFHELAE